jgi:hypothetical protein
MPWKHHVHAKRVLSVLALMVLWSGAPAGQVVHHAINCGGDMDGFYTADVDYALGSAGYEGGRAVCTPGWEFGSGVIGGLFNPFASLTFTGREDWQAYRFDVPNGPVMLRLHLAEITEHGPGVRKMNLLLEGQPLVSDLDLADRFGLQYGAMLVVTTEVTDGRLDLEVGPGSDPTLLCAVEVWGLPASLPAPAPVTSLEARPSYDRVVLTWDHDTTAMVKAYEIERAEAVLGGDPAGGAFLPLARLWTNPPRWYDEEVEAGTTYVYRVRSVDVFGQRSEFVTVSSSPLSLAQSALPVLELSVEPEDLEFLYLNLIDDHQQEVPALLTYEGTVWPDVEVRFRGGYSRQFAKKSVKLKFPSSAPFQGRFDLNLNAEFLDPTLERSAWGLDLLRGLGHMALRYEPVQLYLNGVHRGVFRSVEQIDLQFLLSRGRDPGGVIFKAEGPLQVLLTPEDYESTYEIKTNTSVGHDGLIAFIEMLSNVSDEDFARSLAEVFDVDGYLTYLAAMIYSTNSDIFHHNYRLMFDPSLDRWELIAWDMDECFLGEPTASLDYSELALDPEKVSVLYERTVANDSLRWILARKLEALATGLLAPENAELLVTPIHDALLDDVPRDPFKRGWEHDLFFQIGEDWVLDTWIPQRQAFVLSELPGYQPATPPPSVLINELLARNLASPVDEVGEHEDFVELYNSGTAAVDLGGMFLTDDVSDPTRWMIPAGTSLPAGEHLLIWADGEPLDGPFHASFSLRQSGEELALFDSDGATLLDVIHFGPQWPDVSYGRRTDGGALFAPLPSPTPGQPNIESGNLPPLVTWVEQLPHQPLPSQPATARCMVQDDNGLAAVDLHLRIDGANAGVFPMAALPADRYEVALPALPMGSFVEYWIEAVDGLGKSILAPWNAPDSAFQYIVQDPTTLPLRINEFLADNLTQLPDQQGEFEDWIELVNTGATPVSLAGLSLTDDLGDPGQWSLPSNQILAAGGHLLVWADDDVGDGPLHANFKLSKGGETVALFSAGGEQLIDSVVFGPQTTDVSTARLPDAGQLLVTLLDPTPGAPNLPAAGEALRYAGDDPAHNPLGLSAITGAESGMPWVLDMTAGPAAGATTGALVLGTAPIMTPVNLPGIVGDALLLPLPGVLILFDTLPDGTASVVVPIPSNPALEGMLIQAQYVIENHGLSNAVMTTIGS